MRCSEALERADIEPGAEDRHGSHLAAGCYEGSDRLRSGRAAFAWTSCAMVAETATARSLGVCGIFHTVRFLL